MVLVAAELSVVIESDSATNTATVSYLVYPI